MGKKRKSAVLTRGASSKKICGNPSEFDRTEPPTARQVIQYFYFVENSKPELKYMEIVHLIAKELVSVWQPINPRLPLKDYRYIVKSVNRLLDSVKEYIRTSLSPLKQQNLENKLDKMFDISSCTSDLLIQTCTHSSVKCKIKNCNIKHILCTCPPRKKSN